MSFFKRYIEEIEKRGKEGLKPKPIDDGNLIKEIIDNIRDDNNTFREQSLKFFIFIKCSRKNSWPWWSCKRSNCL